MNSKERNVGIDLLRIIAMLFVVIIHVLAQGGVMSMASDTSHLHYYSLKFIQTLGYCAVPVYAIISGYVGVGKKWKPSNLLNLLFTALFYTVIFSVFFYLLKPQTIGLGKMVKAMIPDYWYLACYCGLFMFMPLLNKALETMSQRSLLYLLLIIFVTYSCTSPLFVAIGRDPLRLHEGFSVLWLITLYLVGGYLKLYGFTMNNKKAKMFILFILCVLLTVASKVVTNLLGYGNVNLLYHYTSPTIFLASVAIVVIFAEMKIQFKCKNAITYFATFTFSIYLIHQQELVNLFCVKNQFLWVLNYNALISFVLVIASALAIYVLCTVIDVLRYYLFKFLHVKDFCVYIEKLLTKFASWLSKKLSVK